MTIQDYKDAKAKATRLEETLMHTVRSSILAAEEKLRAEDGLLDRSKLNSQATIDEYVAQITNPLISETRNYYGIPNDVERDIFRDNELLFGRYGLNTTALMQGISQSKDKTTYDALLESIVKGMQTNLNNLRSVPLLALTNADAESVVRYTNTLGRIDPVKLTLPDMSQLIDIYDQLGIIPPKALENKHYLL